MGLRYRQRYVEAGDVLEPRDWNLNMAELASEWNGSLDSHNLPVDAVVEGHLSARCAANLRGTSATTTLATVDDLVSWLPDDGASSPVKMGESTFTADYDCVLVCEYGCLLDWDTGVTYSGTGNYGTEVDCVRFRIVVDGIVVAESGFLSEEIDLNGVYLCGVAVVQAGSHTVRAEYQKLRITNHNVEGGSTRGLDVLNRELIVHERYR